MRHHLRAGRCPRREGLPEHRIALTGNTIVEATTHALPAPDAQLAILRHTGVRDDEYVLATTHRPENVDDDKTLDVILDALARTPWPVVLPLHPRLRARLAARCDTLRAPSIRLIEHLPHPHLLALARHARLVVTDSGGLQGEITVLKTAVLVVRRSNERPEIEGLFGRRVEPDALMSALMADVDTPHRNLQLIPSPYGDGTASARIADEARRPATVRSVSLAVQVIVDTRPGPVYEKDRLDPVDPTASLELDPDVLASYPEGYRHLAYVQAGSGRRVMRGLPGRLGPAADLLHAEGRAWLAGSERPGVPLADGSTA